MAAVIPAAGAGVRMGGQLPKAWLELGGRTLLEISADAMIAAGVSVLVIAVPARVPDRSVLTALESRAESAAVRLEYVPGGAERSDSVAAAIETLHSALPDLGCVLIHDAARPLTPASVIGRVIDSVLGGADAVVPVLPVADTIKEVDGNQVVRTVDRARLAAVQTPQGFSPAALREVYARERGAVTDDASLVEAAGGTVVTVPGDAAAFKITHPHDLVVARALLAGGHLGSDATRGPQ